MKIKYTRPLVKQQWGGGFDTRSVWHAKEDFYERYHQIRTHTLMLEHSYQLFLEKFRKQTQ